MEATFKELISISGLEDVYLALYHLSVFFVQIANFLPLDHTFLLLLELSKLFGAELIAIFDAFRIQVADFARLEPLAEGRNLRALVPKTLKARKSVFLVDVGETLPGKVLLAHPLTLQVVIKIGLILWLL